MVLFGFLLALGGAEVFELVGLKGDLGALVSGILGRQPQQGPTKWQRRCSDSRTFSL